MLRYLLKETFMDIFFKYRKKKIFLYLALFNLYTINLFFVRYSETIKVIPDLKIPNFIVTHKTHNTIQLTIIFYVQEVTLRIVCSTKTITSLDLCFLLKFYYFI